MLKLTQWEDALSDGDLCNLQVEFDRLSKDVERLSALLKKRTQERQRQVRNGLLRVAPRTLRDLAQRGKSKSPQHAFMSNASGDKENIVNGALVALEDSFPVKQWLTEDDLVVAMQDVGVVEAEKKP